MEDASSPQVPAFDLPVLNFIRQKYLPASRDTATLRLTTLEIAEQIAAHVGPNVASISDIYNWLTENGYTFDTVGDMRFEWLLKEAD